MNLYFEGLTEDARPGTIFSVDVAKELGDDKVVYSHTEEAEAESEEEAVRLGGLSLAPGFTAMWAFGPRTER
jgi:hypothetical protein